MLPRELFSPSATPVVAASVARRRGPVYVCHDRAARPGLLAHLDVLARAAPSRSRTLSSGCRPTTNIPSPRFVVPVCSASNQPTERASNAGVGLDPRQALERRAGSESLVQLMLHAGSRAQANATQDRQRMSCLNPRPSCMLDRAGSC